MNFTKTDAAPYLDSQSPQPVQSILAKVFLSPFGVVQDPPPLPGTKGHATVQERDATLPWRPSKVSNLFTGYLLGNIAAAVVVVEVVIVVVSLLIDSLYARNI